MPGDFTLANWCGCQQVGCYDPLYGQPQCLGLGCDGATDGDALTYAWAFSDGGSTAGASASHTFAAAGNYTATLTVSDGKGGFERKRRALHTWIEDKDSSDSYITWALLESGTPPPPPVTFFPQTAQAGIFWR